MDSDGKRIFGIVKKNLLAKDVQSGAIDKPSVPLGDQPNEEK